MQQEDTESALLQRIAAQAAPQKIVREEPTPSEKVFAWALPGFGAHARVMTSFGLVPMEALRRRDPIKTHAGRFLEVQYIDEIRLDRRFLLTHPEAHPIVIPRGAMGTAVPTQEIYVSGGQKVRTPGRFDQAAGLPASEFVGRGGIAQRSHGYFTYYVFHCGQPCTINVDGLWVDVDPNVLANRLH